MNDYAWKSSALLAIVVGILICFWGYRLLKASLAIIGFVAGAYGGWELGLMHFSPGSSVLLVCALVGGLIGLVLCVWLYFVGVFLIGATAGTVLAQAFVGATGHQVQPLLYVGVPILCGLIALVLQKLMISAWTAVTGSYLATAGIWPFLAAGHAGSNLWLDPAANRAPLQNYGYAALGLWLVLAVIGFIHQWRGHRRAPQPAPAKPRP